MAFLKKHYEKILLGVMLAGLIGLLVFMLAFISSDKQQMEDMRNSLINPHVTLLSNVDLTIENNATLRAKSPYFLDFESTNKLLNPQEWQRALDGGLIPAKNTGLRMAVVTNITPLYFIVSLDSVITNEAATNYVIKVERQAAATKSKQQPVRRFASLHEKPNDLFALVSVKGPGDSPESLTLKLMDTQEEITVSKDKPYRRVDGYAADFRYDPEKKVFRQRRVNDRVSFGGVDYVVVDINQNEVILMDQSNQKKTSLPFTP